MTGETLLPLTPHIPHTCHAHTHATHTAMCGASNDHVVRCKAENVSTEVMSQREMISSSSFKKKKIGGKSAPSSPTAHHPFAQLVG